MTTVIFSPAYVADWELWLTATVSIERDVTLNQKFKVQFSIEHVSLSRHLKVEKL